MAVYRIRFSSIPQEKCFVLVCSFDPADLDTAPLTMSFASEAAIAEALAKTGIKWDTATALPSSDQWFTLTTHRLQSIGFTKVP